MIWPGGALYVLAAILVARPVAGHLAYEFAASGYSRNDRPDAWQWSGAVLIAVGLAALWPLVLAWGAAGRVAPTIGAERAEMQRRRKRDLARRERELREAERDLGLDP